jgi:hypothetical protein
VNSLILDYILRQKVAANVSMFYIEFLPIPRLTAGNPHFDAIVPLAARLVCTRDVFASLWQSVVGSPWSESSAVTAPAARQALRDQLDAQVAHLYGLSRTDYAHLLGTFPLVFPADAAGAARKAAVLAAYDAL